MRARALAPIAVAIVLAGPRALASPTYPDAMKGDLSLPSAPKCDLCHAAAVAPVGSASTPFARSMIARGLLGNDDVASLKSALDRMAQDGVDSDGDGARDLDELSWGGDPNVADVPEGGPVNQVHYGCAYARVATGACCAVVLAAAAGVWAVRRKSKRRRGA